MPVSFRTRHLSSHRIALSTLKLCLFACLVVFVLLPLLFKYSVTLQRGILFLTFSKFTISFQNLELY